MALKKQNDTDNVLLQPGDALLLQDEGAVQSFDGDISLTIGSFSASLEGTHAAPVFDGSLDVTLGSFSPDVSGSTGTPGVGEQWTYGESLSLQLTPRLNDLTGRFAVAGIPAANVTLETAEVVQPSKRNKGGRVRKKRRYLIEIDGQYFDAINVREVEEILHQAEKIAPQAKKKPVIKVRTRTGPTKSKVINRAIRRVEYKFKASKNVDKEIGELLQKVITRERMQEEALIALIL